MEGSSAWAAVRPRSSTAWRWGTRVRPPPWPVSFTSEAAAREGEPKELPPELKVQLEELAALSVGEPEFFDLKQPWLYVPR